MYIDKRSVENFSFLHFVPLNISECVNNNKFSWIKSSVFIPENHNEIELIDLMLYKFSDMCGAG